MNTEPIITFVCDMCQKIENYDDRFCYNGQDLCIECYSRDEEEEEPVSDCHQHYLAGQYDCPKCAVEQPKETVLNCLTFIIDRIVDQETNDIKENECPVCMEQMKDPEIAPEGYHIFHIKNKKAGSYCAHQHCQECYFALLNLDNKCSICRQHLMEEEEEMPGLIAEDEEDGPCQDCGRLHSPIWGPADELQGIWCDDCYNSRVDYLDQQAAEAEVGQDGPCNFCNAVDGHWCADVSWCLCDNCYDNCYIQDADEQPHLCEICQAPGATIRPERPDSEWLCDNCEDGH